MAEVTWFKVLTDIFSDDKIKIVQSMPEGDSLLVMWFKILAQAGKTNDGGYIYLKKDMPYTPGMLATLFNKPQHIVELALRTFSQFGMIDIDDEGYIFVTNWEKHQSVDKLNRIKEQTRLRVQNHREKKKQELLESNATVTLQKQQNNATEVDKELDKDINTTIEANPYKVYESEGFGLISSFIKEEIDNLSTDYGDRWVCEAMKRAVLRGKRNIGYVRGILVNWKADGIDEPWKEDKQTNEKPKGVVKELRPGGHQETSHGSQGKSGVLPSKYFSPEDLLRMSEVSG